MARISLRSIINDDLINRFRGLASGGSSNNLANALRGEASSPDIQSGLRTGARTFASAVQALNTGISFLNATGATLQQLGKLTDRMIALAEKASASSSSSQNRHDADIEYKRLTNQFERALRDAKLGDREFLTISGISEYFKVLGLDADKSSSIQAVFDRFVVPREDDTLASEEIEGERPVKIPPSAYSGTARFTVEYDSLFADNVTLTTRPNAYKVMTDLKALREQIDDNVKAVENAIDTVGKNIDLVRTAGLAFLELSDQINSSQEAEQVASSLRDRIRREAAKALSQAENLEPIIVATLALNPDDLKLN
ncbi:MAG: hypothetical protein J5J00_14110 [Deltaproteobacteria bacterium]|nr:hypothetical protein [Deltaproteobacteria bacterium]